MPFFHKSLIFVFLFWPILGNSTSPIRDHVNSHTPLYDNSFIETVYSGCNLSKYKLDEINADFFQSPINNPYFFSEKSILNFFLVKNENGHLKKAPLVIFMTGIFGGPFTGLGRHMVKRLTDSGFHVISLGNPLGEENLKLKPKYPLASFINEAEAYWVNVKLGVQNLKRLNLISENISMIGVSYGGFITAIMRKFDQSEASPFIKKLVLISPPLNMGIGLGNMDQLILESEKYRDKSDLWFDLKSIKYCLSPPRVSSEKEKEIAQAIFAHSGFQRDMADKVSLADSIYDWHLVPKYSKTAYRNWRRRFLFNDYFNDFFPVLKRLYYSRASDLGYWLDFKNKNNLIFSASDDPLNYGQVWPIEKSVFLIETGGHYGFANSEFYEKFLRLVFNWLK
ncbi:MAG: hypothetical protein CME61_02690 [Halobacteriovoraceae bacterium]|nr:hypothetical protein [Halobacteriovoraceae bacterium]